MHFTKVLAAATLAASTTEAAPRGSSFKRWLERTTAGQSHADREHLRYHAQKREEDVRHGTHKRSTAADDAIVQASNNGTAPMSSEGEKMRVAHKLAELPVVNHKYGAYGADDVGVECPTAASVVVKTETEDVTVYVTEIPPTSTPEGEEPCDEDGNVIDDDDHKIDEDEHKVDKEDDDDTLTIGVDDFGNTTTDCDEDETATEIIPQTTESCETDSTITPDGTPTPTTVATVVTTDPAETTVTDEDDDDKTTEVIIPTTSKPDNATMVTTSSKPPVKASTTPAPKPMDTTTGCIDTSIVPITTGKLTVTVAAPEDPTRTVIIDDHETGVPESEVAYCGVKGKPAGVYFIAEFIEERSTVPVTEEGCYQFCTSVMESTDGCQSYRFYHNELGAPRCALYGAPVASVVDDLDEKQDDMWFDLACGSPEDGAWQTVVAEEPTPTPTPKPKATTTSKSESESKSTSKTTSKSELKPEPTPETTLVPTTKDEPKVDKPESTEKEPKYEPKPTEKPEVEEPKDEGDDIIEPVNDDGNQVVNQDENKVTNDNDNTSTSTNTNTNTNNNTNDNKNEVNIDIDNVNGNNNQGSQ